VSEARPYDEVVKIPPPTLAQRLVSVSEEVLRPDRDLRLEDVAALVGSKRATLYYYFSGREDLIAFLLLEHLAAAAQVMTTASDAQPSPAERLRSAVAALVGFLGERPGVCAGLLSFAGAAGRMASVLAAKDSAVAEPIRCILADGPFEVGDARDATSAMLGAAMIATVDRWYRGDAMTPAFQQRLTEQIVRGVLRD
jgi:TetR/AcrR family transcriptional regulator